MLPVLSEGILRSTEKFFNTAGPVNQPEHYKIDPLHRWNLDDILTLIDQRKYFILQAPRQTGKTSSLLALADYLNAGSDYIAVYANIEAAQAACRDVTMGMGAILRALQQRLEAAGLDAHGLAKEHLNAGAYLSSNEAGAALSAYLTAVSSAIDKPLVLFLDEIDALVGDTLISVLR